MASQHDITHNPSQTATSSLSNEQLMDYIKKQKAKIKTLENKLIKYEGVTGQDKANSIEANKESSSTYLFWEFISKQSPFHQKLAKCALTSMITTFETSQLGQQYLPTVKSLFAKWKENVMLMKLGSITALEQKNAKLKALLARTHSINQKNIEDSNMLKQRQQEALNELKNMKERDGSERQALLEQVRLRTIESAFQQDVELAIQKAADEMLSSTTRSSVSSYNPSISPYKSITHNSYSKIEELESTIMTLNNNVDSLTNQRQHDLQAMRQVQEKLMLSETHHSKLKASYDELNEKYNELNHKLINEILAKQDLETELDVINKARTKAIQEFHNMSEQLIQVKVAELTQLVTEKQSLIEDLREEYEDLMRKHVQLKNIYDQEVDKHVQANATELEVNHLKLVIADLRKQLNMVSKKKGLNNGNDNHDHGNNVVVIPTVTPPTPPPPPVIIYRPPPNTWSVDSDNATLLRTMMDQASNAVKVSKREISNKNQIIAKLQRKLKEATESDSKRAELKKKLEFMLSRYLSPFLTVDTKGEPLKMEQLNHIDKAFVDAYSRKLVDLNMRVNILEAVIKDLQSLLIADMTWEASSFLLTAGKDTNLFLLDPLPSITIDPQSRSYKLVEKLQNSSSWKMGTLEWCYSGENVQKISLLLTSQQSPWIPGTNTNQHGIVTFTSISKHSHDVNHHNSSSIGLEYEGKHDLRINTEPKVLKIINGALWGQATLSYTIHLCFRDHNQEITKLINPLQQELENVIMSRYGIEQSHSYGQSLASELYLLMENANELVNDPIDSNPIDSNQIMNQDDLKDDFLNEFDTIDELCAKIRKKMRKGFDATVEGAATPSSEIQTSNSSNNLPRLGSSQSSESSSAPPSRSPSIGPQSFREMSVTNRLIPSLPTSVHQTGSNPLTETSNAITKIDPIVFACESIVIRAGDDLRIQIPYSLIPTTESTAAILMTWNFDLKLNHANTNQNNSTNAKDTLDIGFAVAELQSDGALPQLVSYRRVPRSLTGTNIGHTILCLDDKKEIQLPKHIYEKKIPIINRGEGTSVVVIFDNSYSWYRSKEMRYHISLEPIIPEAFMEDLNDVNTEKDGLINIESLANQTDIQNSVDSSSDDESDTISPYRRNPMGLQPSAEGSLEETKAEGRDLFGSTKNLSADDMLLELCQQTIEFVGTSDILKFIKS